MQARRFAMAFTFAVMLALLAAVPGPSGKDVSPRIGLAAAFGAELDALRDGMTLTRIIEAGGVAYTVGRVGEREAVLIHAGPGMVNAAARLQHAADHFTLTHIIFSGVAGSLDRELAIGAVVVPERWINHQFGAVTEDGFAPLPLDVRPPGGTHAPLLGFDVDGALLEIARSIPDADVGGTGVSGDLFVADEAVRTNLADAFGARIVDMESAAAAQVAYLNGIPYLAVRAISDQAGEDAPGEIADSVGMAAKAAAATVLDMVQRMPKAE